MPLFGGVLSATKGSNVFTDSELNHLEVLNYDSMKSLLLGSAATLVVVAGAQAADLPTKKGAPAAEYVKVCKVGDIAGFIIPGSDTCLKISGYITGQLAMGNVSDEYKIGDATIYAYTRQVRQRLRLLDPRSGQLRRGDQHRDGPAAWPHRNPDELGPGQRLRRARRPGAQLRLRAMGGHHRRQARLVLRLPGGRRHLEGLLLARPQRHAGQPAGLYRFVRRRLLGDGFVGAARTWPRRYRRDYGGTIGAPGARRPGS